MTATRAMTWQTSLSHVTRSGGGWGKTGKRSLALKLQIMACDDKRGPNKTQHPSLLNEMSGRGSGERIIYCLKISQGIAFLEMPFTGL